MTTPPIKLLLVEDDEDDYVIVLEHLCQIQSRKFDLDWVCSYPEAVVELTKKCHDLYIFDYRLGLDNGIDLIAEAKAHACPAPIIMLTRYCDRFLEKKAREAGAVDFLLKSNTNPATLEQAILVAIEKNSHPNPPASLPDNPGIPQRWSAGGPPPPP